MTSEARSRRDRSARCRLRATTAATRKQEEARALRSRLLAYRFDALNRTGIRSDCFDPSLTPRANQVMIPLLSIFDDSPLREAIRASMRGTESRLSVERAASPEGQLVEVLTELLAADTRDAIPVGEVADAYRRKHGLDYDRPITARYVGYLLRQRLHLSVVRRRGVFMVDSKNRRHLMAQAERLGVSKDQNNCEPAIERPLGEIEPHCSP